MYPSIPVVNTLPHITQSARKAPTPAIAPARIQLCMRILRRECALLPFSRHAELGHRSEVLHRVQLLPVQQPLLHHQLPHRDVPTAWKHTMFTISAIDGFTLPGMMLEPGCTSGRRISASPVRGPEASSRMSLAILPRSTA